MEAGVRAERRGYHCRDLRGLGGGLGAAEKGRSQHGQEEVMLTQRRVDGLTLVFRTSNPRHLCLPEL